MIIARVRAWIDRKRGRRWVHPATHEIAKFFPKDPPTRGDTVLVDGKPCQVVRSVLTWEGRTWRLLKPGVLVVDLDA